MAENSIPPFNQAWLESQKKFWDAWNNMAREAASAGGTSKIPDFSDFNEGLDIWWRNVSPVAPAQSRELFERFVEQGKQFFQFNDSFLSTLKDANAAPANAAEWQKFWEQNLSTLRENMSKLPTGLPGSEHVLGMWNFPLEQWKRVAGMMSGGMNLPGANWANLYGGQMPSMPNMFSMDDMQKQMEKMLNMPGVGYTREWQGRMQTLASLGMEHQKAFQEYNKSFSKVGVAAVNSFQSRIVALSGSGEGITSVRQIYDLWIDCAEDAYADLITTDEYAEINARMVNTMMAWKQQGRSMMDDVMGMLNLPTRRELESVHKRLRDLKRQQRNAGSAPTVSSGGNTSALEAEIKALRAEVNELKDAAEKTTAARKPPARKSTAAPKAAANKEA